MTISMYVPKEANVLDIRKFIRNEVAEAENIKKKQTRKQVISGLNKIDNALRSGYAFFSDGDEIIVQPYDGIKKIYHCGKKPLVVHEERIEPILMVVIDAKEATIGTTNGERITVLWSDTSMVMGKHHKGGQSSRRFERDRERAVKEWLRLVVDKVKEYATDDKDIIVGGCGMTKDQFIKELPK